MHQYKQELKLVAFVDVVEIGFDFLLPEQLYLFAVSFNFNFRVKRHAWDALLYTAHAIVMKVSDIPCEWVSFLAFRRGNTASTKKKKCDECT